MCRTQLIGLIAGRTGIKRQSIEAVLNAFQELIADALYKGDQVVLSGFGTFSIKSRNSRTGRNIQTGEPVAIPARALPSFTPSDALKARISGHIPEKNSASKSPRSSPAK